MPNALTHKTAVLAATAILAAFASSAQATIWFVRQTGSDSNSGKLPSAAFRTVQKAATVAVAGDIIYVGAGTYNEAISPANSGSNAQSGRIAYLADTDGMATGDAGTVILTRSGNIVLSVTGRSNMYFRGFTIQGGTNNVKFDNGSGLTLEACTVQNSTNGPNVRVTNGANVTIRNCNMYSASGGSGIGLYIQAGGTVTAEGISVIGATQEAIRVENSNSTATIARARVSGGDAGLFVQDGRATITGSLITGSGSDGIRSQNSNASITIWNCTIAGTGNDGVQVNQGTINLYNCILTRCSKYGLRQNGNGGTINKGNNIYWDNGSGPTKSVNLSGSELTVDPRVTDAVGGDYTLQQGSPAIDAGQTPSISGMDVDLAGCARVGAGTRYDIGAYEYMTLAPQAVPYTSDFESASNPGWLRPERESAAGLTSFAGRFASASAGKDGQTLALATSPGETYTVTFDLYLNDTWDGELIEVLADGRRAWSRTWNGSTGAWGGLEQAPERWNTNTVFGSGNDAVFRRLSFCFTASQSRTLITWRSTLDESSGNESWGIDNIRIEALAVPSAPYSFNFNTCPGPEWSNQAGVNYGSSAAGMMSGPFSASGPSNSNWDFQTLRVSTTPGTTYHVAFDLLLNDTWDGNNTTYGPDALTVAANDTIVFNQTFSAWPLDNGFAQSYPLNPDDFLDASVANYDWIYRRVTFSFTATAGITRLTWRSPGLQGLSDESWCIDNVAVVAQGDPAIFASIPRFRDVSSSVGFGFSAGQTNTDSGGIHAADLNNDGFTDFIIGGTGQSRVAIWNRAANTYTVSVLGSGAVCRQGVLLDYDGDGALDFFGTTNSNSWGFYRNGGAGVFGPPSQLGFVTGPASPRACAGVDAGADGWTDVALFDGGGTNYLAANSGAGSSTTFTAGSAPLPQGNANAGSGAFVSVADVNNDGVPDFFYHYNNGRLFLSGGSSWSQNNRGIAWPNLSAACGSAWGDYNNDGWPDLYTPSRQNGQAGALWRNPGSSGNFVNVNSPNPGMLSPAGLSEARQQTSSCWGDYDNDGWPDLFVASVLGSVLYHNNGDGTFARAFEGVGVYGQVCDCCFVDADNDGDLDLVVTVAGQGQRMLRNMTCDYLGQNRSLKVRAVIPGSGAAVRQDVRARIELYRGVEPALTLVGRRDTGVARGLGGEEPFWAHFAGIDPNATYTVKVFCGGRTSTQTVVPSATRTQVGPTTIPQALTVSLGQGVALRTWQESSP